MHWLYRNIPKIFVGLSVSYVLFMYPVLKGSDIKYQENGWPEYSVYLFEGAFFLLGPPFFIWAICYHLRRAVWRALEAREGRFHAKEQHDGTWYSYLIYSAFIVSVPLIVLYMRKH